MAVVVLVAYLAGAWRGQDKTQSKSESAEKAALHYICPMHPGIKSDKPGVAPCCGMQLEPVYPEKHTAQEIPADAPPGSIFINPDRQQLIGLKTDLVEKGKGLQTCRILGRVSTDETRVYRVLAADNGWIREVYPNTSGSLVKKGQPLAAFYATPSLQAAQLTYINTLNLVAQNPASNGDLPGQAVSGETRIQAASDALRNLGVSDEQIEELARTRKPMKNILVCAPETGFVVVRNISMGQRFSAGEELYRIVNLSRIWILADLFENEARYLQPGLTVTVHQPYLGKTFKAQVSKVLPQFDASSRTLKVRLEADNPGFRLRPDMFVDVEISINQPKALSIPADAVLFSGLRKTVFVDRGNGVFEPREVQTGWKSGGRIEITSGLNEGEKVVVSGNFLIDSESRMKNGAPLVQNNPAPDSGTGARQNVLDPVCGMTISVAASTLHSQHKGKTYYFCMERCKQLFDANPAQFSAISASGTGKEPDIRRSGEKKMRHDLK